ncbi:hypothetical protein V8F33_003377 [Rhypophila sp. PSN 637]
MSDEKIVPGSVYFYAPNKGAAIFFTVAFAVSGLYHVWQCFYFKCFKLTTLLTLSCAVLTTAYATRAYGSVHYDDTQVYTASTLLLYIAPPIFQLANLQILGRLYYFVPYFALMHPARMFLTFASITAVIEILAVMGVAYLSNRSLPEKSTQMGDAMAKASLVLQLIQIAITLLMVITFHHVSRQGKITKSPRVTRPLAILYTTTGLLLLRTLYATFYHFATPANPTRALQDQNGPALPPILFGEVYFLVLDSTPILLSTILWNIFHPRSYLPADDTRYLAQDGRTELKGPGWKDSRSLTETFMNPFASLTHRAGHEKPFWERNGYAFGRSGRVVRTGGQGGRRAANQTHSQSQSHGVLGAQA